MALPQFRTGGPDDAGAVALLHADSWRRNYRGVYADAYLDPASPMRADAVTVNPFLGFGSIAPFLQVAERFGGGVFVLLLCGRRRFSERASLRVRNRRHLPQLRSAPDRAASERRVLRNDCGRLTLRCILRVRRKSSHPGMHFFVGLTVSRSQE